MFWNQAVMLHSNIYWTWKCKSLIYLDRKQEFGWWCYNSILFKYMTLSRRWRGSWSSCSSCSSFRLLILRHRHVFICIERIITKFTLLIGHWRQLFNYSSRVLPIVCITLLDLQPFNIDDEGYKIIILWEMLTCALKA